MSDNVKDSQEYKDLLAKLEAKEKASDEQKSKLDNLASVVEEIKNDRDGLKTKLKEQTSADETKDATNEQLKELLKTAQEDAEKAKSDSLANNIKSQILQMASKRNFVSDKEGKINKKMLFANLDPSKFVLDDAGEIIGLGAKFDSLKKSESYLFAKQNKALNDKDPSVKEYKGLDISDKAMENAKTVSEQGAIMKAKMAQNSEVKNNMMSGMGNATI